MVGAGRAGDGALPRPGQTEEGEKTEESGGGGRRRNQRQGREVTHGPHEWVVGMEKKYEEHECRRSGYEGENIADWDGIFCFEGENKGTRVWMV
jgi:hypothetical protein